MHACILNFLEGLCLSAPEPSLALLGFLVIYGKCADHMAAAGDVPFKFLTYQLPTGRYWLPVAMTGNGELGFGFGELLLLFILLHQI